MGDPVPGDRSHRLQYYHHVRARLE
jgi:hypothetical protein